MTSYVCTEQAFLNEFGALTDAAKEVVLNQYPMMTLRDHHYYYQFNLEKLFSEHVDLFSVDSSLVSDMFVINVIFSDESIDTDIIVTLTEVVQWSVEYDPINDAGEFWLSFADIRKFYGEYAFDKEMARLFPKEYESFKEYFLE